MLAILHLLTTLVADLFKSQRRPEIENLFLPASAQTRDILTAGGRG
jgi:hypothetical protein